MQSHGFILHLLSRCLLNGGVMTAEPIIRAPIIYLCFMWDRFQPILDISTINVVAHADIALHGWIVDLDAMDSDAWSLSRSQNPLMPHYVETQEFDTLDDSCIPSHNHSTRITKKTLPAKNCNTNSGSLDYQKNCLSSVFSSLFLIFPHRYQQPWILLYPSLSP